MTRVSYLLEGAFDIMQICNSCADHLRDRGLIGLLHTREVGGQERRVFGLIVPNTLEDCRRVMAERECDGGG